VDLSDVLAPARFIGRAPEQVEEFVERIVAPIRTRYASSLGAGGDLNV